MHAPRSTRLHAVAPFCREEANPNLSLTTRLHAVTALSREEAGGEGASATGLHLAQVGHLLRVRVRGRLSFIWRRRPFRRAPSALLTTLLTALLTTLLTMTLPCRRAPSGDPRRGVSTGATPVIVSSPVRSVVRWEHCWH
eukprot:scaffold67199_cov44-Phaeocystis_antarctica.AAC.1